MTAAHDPRVVLAARLQAAVAKAFGAEHAAVDPMVRRSERADFQADLAMGLAKKLEARAAAGRRSRRRRSRCHRHLRARRDRRAGLHQSHAEERRSSSTRSPSVARDERLGVPLAAHQGARRHRLLGAERREGDARRSPALHDHRRRARARCSSSRATRSFAQNHIGDWGTPFGMLIEHLLDVGRGERAEPSTVGELSDFYRAARDEVRRRPGVRRARARSASCCCRPATRDARRCGARSSTSRSATSASVYERLGVGLRERARARRELLQPDARRRRRRARAQRPRVRSTTARCACSRRGSRTATASRCR